MGHNLTESEFYFIFSAALALSNDILLLHCFDTHILSKHFDFKIISNIFSQINILKVDSYTDLRGNITALPKKLIIESTLLLPDMSNIEIWPETIEALRVCIKKDKKTNGSLKSKYKNIKYWHEYDLL